MRASRYVFLLYLGMIGVPVLLYLRLISQLSGLRWIATGLLALAALGLIVFGISGLIEVYSDGEGWHSAMKVPIHRAPSGSGGADEESAKVTFRVRRFDAETQSMKSKEYRVGADRLTTVLGALMEIKEEQDPTLAIRYSCRMGICGSCGMVVNGKPSLACETNVCESMRDKVIEIEPMYGHPLLKDLVTDFDDFFEKHMSVSPTLYRKDADAKYDARRPFRQSREEIDRFLPYSYCIMCGLCQDACPVVNSNPKFIGPQALSQVYRYHADTRDEKGARRLFEVDTIDGVWGCEFAGACSKVCPKGVDPSAAIQLLKGDIMKEIGTEE